MTVTQPLRDEHKELFLQVELLKNAADSVGVVSQEELKKKVDEAYDFLTHHLIPHATAEDKALYPVVGKVMDALDATKTMSRDHVEVGKLTEELTTLRQALSDEVGLRRVLYGLYALVKVHFAKEEEIYLPLLDSKLSQEEAEEMFENMENAAKEAKSKLG